MEKIQLMKIKFNQRWYVGADYNNIMNIYNNTDNANENVDEIYEK